MRLSPTRCTALVALLLVASGCGATRSDAARDARDRRERQVLATSLNDIVLPFAVALRADLLIWPVSPEGRASLDDSLLRADQATTELDRQQHPGLEDEFDDLHDLFVRGHRELVNIQTAIASGDEREFDTAIRRFGAVVVVVNDMLNSAEVPPMFALPVLGSPPQY